MTILTITLTIINIFLTLISSYYLIILFFIYFIYNNKFKNLKNNYELKSLIKDKDYLLFKNSLINFYYSTIIILLFFIFKNNGLIYLIDLNTNFILFLLSIIIFILFYWAITLI